MILILSNHGDFSTDIVIDWLRSFKANFLRINSFDFLENTFFYSRSRSKSQIRLGGYELYPEEIGSVWFRKFGFFRYSKQCRSLHKELDSFSIGHISTEFSRILESFEHIFSKSFWLTNPKYVVLNKPVVLTIASELGFLVPDTFIINNKADLEYLISCNNQRYITKSIYDPLSISLKGERYMMYTTEVTRKDLRFLPETFFPSMLQEFIEKEYEIRVFFLSGNCFSMAIMSQSDAQTRLDYRKYNYDNPNRFIPYKLPNEIETKISNLMNILKLNTGSIDFIVDKKGVLYFLEINPTGQFGMVDFSCNYGLHKKVAELLINNDNNII
jgi:ATP-GRASP peptide maturase of grasp-with-spasm system